MPNASSIETFRQSFREEAREIVVDLEATLLELHRNPRDAELVGKAFRGLHTIKGSGAMFRFDALASFTHELENAFDAVRNGTLAITATLIDLTLAALDQIRLMIEEDEDAAGSEPDKRAEILAKVRLLAGEPRQQPPSTQADESLSIAASDAHELRQWRIRFAPGPELMRDGTNPLLLLNELRQLGAAEIHADLSSIPPLDEMDPERCYIRWDVQLTTRSGEDAIRDIFIFVEDACELTIEAAADVEPAVEAGEYLENRFEDRLEDQRSGTAGRRPYDKPDTASSIRVPAAKLDQFVDLVGELVTVQARLGEIATRLDQPEVTAASKEQDTGAEQINKALQQLEQVIQQNASASEEMASTTEELTSQAEQLVGALSFFQTGDDTHAPARSTSVRPAAGARQPLARQPKPNGNAATNSSANRGNGLHSAVLKPLTKAGVTLRLNDKTDELDRAFERY